MASFGLLDAKGNKMTYGESVRILVEADCVERGQAGRGGKPCGTVEPGQLGLYLYPCPGTFKRSGWHVIAFGGWDVCLREGQFEKI